MASKAKEKKATTPVIPLEQALPEIHGREAWQIPASHLEKDGIGGYVEKKFRRPSKTLLVNSIRAEVDTWRASDYKSPKGISSTSLRLLEYWFDQDHIRSGEQFRFRFAQREAIETAIYLYEVKKVRDNAELAETYMDEQAYGSDLFRKRKEVIETAKSKRILTRIVPETGLMAQQDLPPKSLTRYCSKAATGSGKTLVMAFIAVWSYFHSKFEDKSDLSKTLLIIAPNVIVYERLKVDFANGDMFRKYPFVPDEWLTDWQMSFIMREDQVRTSTDGTLYLTNIHQLYESRANNGDEDMGPVGNRLGQKPKKDSTASWLTSMYDRIRTHDDLLIINDEAHHVHDDELAWYKAIESFHENLISKKRTGLALLFDLTATPKDQNGTYFPWIITDYPLAQAIEDRIVKTPLIVHQTDKSSPDNKKISNAYNAYNEWIQIALSRYKEHWDCYYKKLSKKPVLFIMAEDTKQADQIAEGIKGLAGFNKKNQVLTIHTKKDGSISETNDKSLEELREDARLIDDEKSNVKVVVSVLMLREGWDVKNVSIILGLRPYTSKANILPEQSVGRGLRLMAKLGPDYTQVLEIIGTDKFEEFVRELEKEGVGIGVTRKAPSIGRFICPLKTREKYNIEIPVLSSSFTRKMEGIASFNPLKLSHVGELDEKGNFKEIKVTLTDAAIGSRLGTKQVVLNDDEFVSSQELLSSISNRIIREGKFSCKFNEVFKIVKDYVKQKSFNRTVDLNSLSVRRTLADAEVSSKIVMIIAKALGDHIRVETDMKITNYPISLIELEGFYWKRQIAECDKTVFNFTPVYNELEKAFALFLNNTKDVTTFAALAETYTQFSIPYLNKKGGQSLYYPDFVAVQQLPGGKSATWIIETKGYEDENVALKDAESVHWCKKASEFTKRDWRFIKIADSFFRKPGQKFTSYQDMLDKLKEYQKKEKQQLILV